MRTTTILPISLLWASSCATAPTGVDLPEGDFLINLYDAFGPERDGLTHDFGFSALVRYGGRTILFDAGTNADVLKANVEALGVNLADVDLAIASHAHFDHINGFDYLLEVNPDVPIYFPADPFWGHTFEFDVSGPEPGAGELLPDDQRYFRGASETVTFRQSGRFWGADVRYVEGTVEIAPGLTLIATRSPYLGYFSRYPTIGGMEEGGDTVGEVKTIPMPELSLNLATDDGGVLIVGCSHSQVEEIVRATREHLSQPIALVYGGYHMLPYTSDEIRGVATRMRDEYDVRAVAPAHCTGHVAFRVFGEVFGERYHAAGLGTVTPFP